MSAEAAKAFDISQADLLRFLSERKPTETQVPIEDRSKHVILIVSIFLFVLALVTCGCTLCLWMVSKRRKQGEYTKLNNEPDKADLACDDDSVKDVIKGTPSLPQISDKPKLDQTTFYTDKDGLDEQGLQQLRVRVESVEVTSNFYVHRNRIQVNVKRVELSQVDEKLSQNAFVYIIVSLLPNKASYFESDVRPIAEVNYFEQPAEFDCLASEITTHTVKVSVYACDRFSQHRLVNEYTYNLAVDEPGEEESANRSVVPVTLNESSRSPDNEVSYNEEAEGEFLFSLCYMPTSGRLTFVALKGRNISDNKDTPIQTYIRVSLLVDSKAMKTFQTASVRRSTAPVYNEAFVFNSPLEHIKNTDIVVSVMTTGEAQGHPKVLGKIVVGPNSEENLGRKHWEAMLSTKRKPVAQWHTLKQ